MRFNLKNRPKAYAKGSMPYIPLGSEWDKFHQTTEEWFEDFEKELRDPSKTWRLKDLVLAMQENKGYFESHKEEKWIKVSKILGDDSK